MAFGGQIGPSQIAVLPALAAMGYDGVEVPVFDPTGVDRAGVRDALRALGLAATVSTSMPAGASLTRAEERARGLAHLRAVSEVAVAIGADLVCGPLASPVGFHIGRPPTMEELALAAEGLQEVASLAAERGVRLAFEPLNRFETYLVTTAAQGVALASEVDRPGFGLLLDTFHMHIEEKDSASAIRAAGRHLIHVHLSENDRGVPGSGQVDWAGVWAALRELGYDGWIVAETFDARIPELAAATAIWRSIGPEPLTYARETLAFARRWVARG